MAAVNVLLFSGPLLSENEKAVQAELAAALEASPRLAHVCVTLPRAEAMLMPRLIGLWDVLVFIGGSGGSPSPADASVVDRQVELLDILPPVLVIGQHEDLWPLWEGFQRVLAQTNAETRSANQSINPTGESALIITMNAINAIDAIAAVRERSLS
jgi:hypothetical protein